MLSDSTGNPFRSLTLLVVDDEEDIREICAITASTIGMKAYAAASAREGLALMERVPVDILLTDLRMPGLNGLELLQRLRKANPDVIVIMMSGYGSIETAVEAMQHGTNDFLSKPFLLADLQAKLAKVAEQCIANSKAQRVRTEVDKVGGFSLVVGKSAEMQQIYRVVTRAANSTSPLLILGEQGTGKELLAKSIHLASRRESEPFIPVDCCSLTPTLLESELFGHVRGSFQGANSNKRGLLASAECGTVLLNEVGSLSLEAQTKLVRVLQERLICPLGGHKAVPFRARILATSSTDLAAAAELGRFRQDLFYRLSVLTVRLPSLRNRSEDIPLLVKQYMAKLAEDLGVRKSISQEALNKLEAFDWPGNVTQFEAVLERAYVLAPASEITLSDVAPLITTQAEIKQQEEAMLSLAEIERLAVQKALTFTGGDKGEAARILGISRTTLYRKLNEYKL